MSIVIGGLGSRTGVIVTWGYGDLVVELIQQIHLFTGVTTRFTKLHGDVSIFEKTNNITSLFNRIIVETSDDDVKSPSGGDLQVIPSVFVLFDGINHIISKYNTINTKIAFMDKVVSEEPIVQVKNPSGGDLQVIPTTSIFYEKQDGILINHEISDKIGTKFVRIVAEEVL